MCHTLRAAETERSGGQKRKEGKEFLHALAFRIQFFSAAEFRISLCEMRRQEIVFD
jgi:hypothetical protein